MRNKLDIQKIIRSQYLAELAVFVQVIVKCPAALWNAPGDKDNFRKSENIELDWVGMQPA